MTPKEYRAFLKTTRQKQLAKTAENEKRIIRVFEAMAADAQKAALKHLGTLSQGFYLSLLSDVRGRIDILSEDFDKALTAGRADLAQFQVDRQGEIIERAGIDLPNGFESDQVMEYTLSTGEEVRVNFGSVAARAMTETAKRVYSHGYDLKGILQNLTAGAKQSVLDTIVQGVGEGASAQRLGEMLHALFTVSGLDTPFYRAIRIARTEISTAYQEAHIQSTKDPQTGDLFDFVQGLQWCLSLSHPKADICDVWAAHDSGLGKGVYLLDDVPQRHPNCLCYVTTVLKAYPEVSAPKAIPNVGDVPDSQVQYWANQGDVPAATVANNRQLEEVSA